MVSCHQVLVAQWIECKSLPVDKSLVDYGVALKELYKHRLHSFPQRLFVDLYIRSCLDDRRLEPELVVMVSKTFVDRHSLPYVQRSAADVVQHI